MKNAIHFLTVILCYSLSLTAFSQTGAVDLQKFLKENKLISKSIGIVSITDGSIKGISGNGLIWLKDYDFKEGTIDVDLQGKDVFQKSFLGIAFHGVDTLTYDIVYFRPFNFQVEDPVRKIHAVQYVSMPDYTWKKLREERNGQYEKAIDPAPAATEWFHAQIVVKGSDVNVYVNHQTRPSLTVKLLNSRTSGKIGLWNEGINGEFANLTIR